MGANDIEKACEIDPMQELCTIRWCVADLYGALEKEGYEPTDANVAAVLARGGRLGRDLQDRSTEEGWEILYALVNAIADDAEREGAPLETLREG